MGDPAHSVVLVEGGYIDLRSTLDGGQAFRWWLQPDGSWRGVLNKTVFRLTETQNGAVAEPVAGDLITDWQWMIKSYFFRIITPEELMATCGDDCIGPAIKGFPGLRVLRQDPWECLVSFIASSISNIPRIKLNIASIARLGEQIGEGTHDYAFPSPETLASAGESTLRRLGLGFRSRYIAGAAEAVESGRLDLNSLVRLPFADARSKLTQLDGVGAKIADCVSAFSLHKGEAFPIDRHVRRALERWYGLSPKLTNTQLAEWAHSRFGKQAALVQQYIFHRERMASRAQAWGGIHARSALPQDSKECAPNA